MPVSSQASITKFALVCDKCLTWRTFAMHMEDFQNPSVPAGSLAGDPAEHTLNYLSVPSPTPSAVFSSPCAVSFPPVFSTGSVYSTGVPLAVPG